jgi:hypothetical protein
MIKIGDKVTFDCLADIKIRGSGIGKEYVTGTVVYIHPKHNWFSVVYRSGENDTPLRTSFHFCDIGQNVFLCKG